LDWWKYVIVCVVGYFLGNINFARIISRSQKKDITELGSGNPGTMNMVRNMGAKWGALTLVGDVVKSVAASMFGLLFIGTYGLYAGGLSAVVGHIYPIIYGLKGGKGVASAIGVFLVAYPVVSLVSFAAAFVFLLLAKYASLTSLILITTLTIYVGYVQNDLAIRIMVFSIWLLVWLGHRSNIMKAIVGKERKTDLAKAFSKIKTAPKTKESTKN